MLDDGLFADTDVSSNLTSELSDGSITTGSIALAATGDEVLRAVVTVFAARLEMIQAQLSAILYRRSAISARKAISEVNC
jgi:hypothetical protein